MLRAISSSTSPPPLRAVTNVRRFFTASGGCRRYANPWILQGGPALLLLSKPNHYGHTTIMAASRSRHVASCGIDCPQFTASRTFFRGNGNNKKKKKKDGSAANGRDKNEKDHASDHSTSSSSNSNASLSASSSSSSSSSQEAAVLVIPSRLQFGDAAPRMPHLLALPLVSRPLFPGFVTSVTLTDEATIDAVMNLHNIHNNNSSSSSSSNQQSHDSSSTTASSSSSSEPSFLSTFLRKDSPTGMTEGGVHLVAPEVITKPSDLHTTGTFAQVQAIRKRGPTTGGEVDEHSANVSATLILLAHRRLDLLSVDDVGPPIDVTVHHWPRLDYAGSNDTIRALSNEIISTIREVAQMNPLFRESLQLFPMRFDANDPFRLADFAASISASGSPEDLQAVLEEKDPEARLHKALVLLNREREVSKLQQEISAKVEEKMSEAQRKYFLNEQLKSIKKELGMERDDKEALIDKYRKQLKQYPEIPAEAKETIDAEMEKFSTLEKNSPEYNVTRSYLDWLVGVPWGVVTEENFDIRQARLILDRDHYGLEDVKDTILQFIAIGKLKGTVQGKILCLVGPPGTGKTSIAKSIAEALGRKFYRFSVGGLSDVSEIKGHRRTYIGAMPGKVIQCLKTTSVINPVVLIDEIDKLGTGFRGDPASALLEVLDPSQNSSFRDHFLDVPVDISKALFICTANDLDRIPGPLLDRMEVIRLSGYDFPEKVAIAEQYLVPKSLRDSGLMIDPAAKDKVQSPSDDSPSDADREEGGVSSASSSAFPGRTPLESYIRADGIPETLDITLDAMKSLVRWYAREAGVRNLAKYIDRITRKLALQIVAEAEGAELTSKSARKSDSWQITANNLSEYVGKPIFTSDRLYEEGTLPNGIVMGLAYTSMGGSALYIETQGIKRGLDADGKPRGSGSLKVTGQLGEVMQESAQIAYTVARARLAQIDADNSYFDITDIHMHVPEGATPKDGPSAGITMVSSMLSLAMDQPIRNDLAMTGEISLTGKVLPVGGIKEKIMAARRAGINAVILPTANHRDFDEIPDYLKEGLEIFYADDYGKVFDVAFDRSIKA